MDFSYPETHIEIKNLSQQILTDFSEPDRLKKLEANGPYIDSEAWQQFVESGLHSASIAEDLGGMALDIMATTMIAEEIGRSLVSIPYIPCIVSTSHPLQKFVSISEVKKTLAAVVSGETIITSAFIEPGNENSLNPNMTAEVSGETVKLTGTKHCVAYGAQASHILLTATSDNELIVALIDTKANGVSIIEQLATSNEPQAQITLEGAEALVITKGVEAEALISESIAITTVAYCAMAVGAADKMMRLGGEYTSQREQFGVPIATFQAVAHRLANCYIDVECLKIITQKAASDITLGHFNHESVDMAKVWAGDVLHRVSQASQHVHGGMGIDKDYHLWRYALWAKQIELTLGNSRVHLAKLADDIEQQYLNN